MRSLRNVALIFCFLTVPAVFAQTAVAQAPTQDWRFAHPGATLVGGFRVKAMLDSPLVNTLIAQATAKDPSTGTMVGMMRVGVGRSFGSSFLGSRYGQGQGSRRTGAGDRRVGRCHRRAPWRKGKTGVRRIDANTLLVGDGQSLEDAVARMSKPATGLQARALDRSKALENNDLWIAGTLPEIPT